MPSSPRPLTRYSAPRGPGSSANRSERRGRTLMPSVSWAPSVGSVWTGSRSSGAATWSLSSRSISRNTTPTGRIGARSPPAMPRASQTPVNARSSTSEDPSTRPTGPVDSSVHRCCVTAWVLAPHNPHPKRLNARHLASSMRKAVSNHLVIGGIEYWRRHDWADSSVRRACGMTASIEFRTLRDRGHYPRLGAPSAFRARTYSRGLSTRGRHSNGGRRR